jgi:amino acid transporter
MSGVDILKQFDNAGLRGPRLWLIWVIIAALTAFIFSLLHDRSRPSRKVGKTTAAFGILTVAVLVLFVLWPLLGLA